MSRAPAVAGLWIALAAGCGRTGPASGGTADSAEVRAVIDRISEADREGDLDAVMALYAEEAVLMPPEGPVVVGREAIGERYAAGFAEATLDFTTTHHETRVTGDWAFDRGITRGRYVWRDGRPPTPFSDKYLMILERRDGAWKIARLIWNAYLP